MTRADQDLSDADQTASEDDQTASDSDQTAADTDQAAADTDQTASEEDQVAAEHAGLEGGGGHARQLRKQASDERAEAASKRHDNSAERDRRGLGRDKRSDARKERALKILRKYLTGADLADIEELLIQAADDRGRAAADRSHAAWDRERAARDRSRAQIDREASGTDELTGARRRGAGLVDLQRAIDHAGRTTGRLVLAFVDVDGLKQVNDSAGHLAGDQLLRTVAETLRRSLRSYDVVIRYGGDEFICALLDSTLDQAQRRFKRIASKLAATPANASISSGFTELRPEDTLEELIERADRQLLDCRAR